MVKDVTTSVVVVVFPAEGVVVIGETVVEEALYPQAELELELIGDDQPEDDQPVGLTLGVDQTDSEEELTGAVG